MQSLGQPKESLISLEPRGRLPLEWSLLVALVLSFEAVRKKITKTRNGPGCSSCSASWDCPGLEAGSPLTCCSFLHEVQLMPEVSQVRVFLLHCQGDEVQQCHLPVSGLRVQQLEGGGGQVGRELSTLALTVVLQASCTCCPCHLTRSRLWSLKPYTAPRLLLFM